VAGVEDDSVEGADEGVVASVAPKVGEEGMMITSVSANGFLLLASNTGC
jgi:hypothetical protein